jgi:hypothetical protein
MPGRRGPNTNGGRVSQLLAQVNPDLTLTQSLKGDWVAFLVRFARPTSLDSGHPCTALYLEGPNPLPRVPDQARHLVKTNSTGG